MAHSPSAADLEFANNFRAFYRSLIPTAGEPDPVAEVRDFTIPAANPARQIAVRSYHPQPVSGQTLPVILFIHGGGFVSGDLDTHDVLCRALALRVPALVLALDYRLAPEYPFPAGLDDCRAALDWLTQAAGSLGGDVRRIAVVGDSAGGNIATALALQLRDQQKSPLLAQVLFYPRTGATTTTESWQQLGEQYFPQTTVMQTVDSMYLGGDERLRDHPLVSPLFAELKDLPPALVVTAARDPLKDEGRAYAEKLQEACVEATHLEYAGAEHGFVQFFKDPVNRPMGEQALEQGVGFLRRHLGVV